MTSSYLRSSEPKHDFIFYAFLLTITLLVCCSCSSTKQVTQVVEHVSKDTIYLSNYQYDSVYVFKDKVTDYSRDTIYIREIQTEYKYRILRDTVLKLQHDSIPYEVTKTVTKEITRPLTWFDHLTRFSFWFLIGALATYIFMKSLCLSEHFVLSEFERSATAKANGIVNTCPAQYIPSLQQLCKTILEPLRAFAGQPIIIGSGYRCPQLNLKVGGVYASQHTLGEAADIVVPKTPYTEWSDGLAHTNMDILNRWFAWIMDHCDFDQLIKETSNGRDYWIHVSCRKNKSKNRHQVLSLTMK